MTAAQINENLYRPILSGHEYDHLFPPSTCNSVKLASGNTKIALNEMRKWAIKYANHASKITKELIGDTLEDTINNIQWFLYNHIQYSIDGIDQNLKSPACAWATRQDGTDCKSYSIFASAILQNLGIAHYFRRIKQDVMTDAFTHVYVVVPIDQEHKKLKNNAVFYQDYLVVDGTIRDNDELPFTEKNDLYMKEPSLPIYGMAGRLGIASCQDRPILIADVPMQQAMGCDCQPQIQMGYGNDVYRPLTFPFTNRFQKDRSQHQVLTFPVGLGGDTTETDTEASASLFSIVASILPTDFFSSTFGAVFSNGFDLSCWNSSSNPAKQKERIAIQQQRIEEVAQSINSNNVEQVLNELSRHITYEWQSFQHSIDRRDWANCTEDAWKLHIAYFKKVDETLLQPLVLELRQKGYVITESQKSVTEQSLEDLYRDYVPDDNTTAEKNGNITYTQYKVISKPASSQTTDTYVDADGNLVTAPSQSQAGFGVGGFLLVAAAIGGIVYGAKKLKK